MCSSPRFQRDLCTSAFFSKSLNGKVIKDRQFSTRDKSVDFNFPTPCDPAIQFYSLQVRVFLWDRHIDNLSYQCPFFHLICSGFFHSSLYNHFDKWTFGKVRMSFINDNLLFRKPVIQKNYIYKYASHYQSEQTFMKWERWLYHFLFTRQQMPVLFPALAR